MKKIIIGSILLLATSSCTLPFGGNKTDETFLGLYKSHVQSSVDSYKEIGTLLGINRHETIDGAIHTAVSVPGILSGALSSDYIWRIDGRNSESFLRHIQVLFTSLVSSGTLSVDEIGLVWYGAESFISYKNINDNGLIPAPIKAIIQKYENTWLDMTEKSVTDMSSEELIGYNIGKNLMTKSLVDIEKYATEYPIWKDIADLGMSGSLHMWRVELDRAHILSLAKTLSEDLTGTGMTDEYAKTLKTKLEGLSFSGKLGFDPKNPKISLLDGTLTASGVLIAEITISKNDIAVSIHIGNSIKKTSIAINYGKKDTKYLIEGSFRQDDIEMGKITGYIEQANGIFHELFLEVSAQGMTVSLKHTVDGGAFTGKLSAVVGTMEWSGVIAWDRLTGLKINGTAPFGSLSVDLVGSGSDTMIRGPVLIKAGPETLVSANVALEVAKEKIAMILDVISEQFPIHFDIAITGKSTPSSTRVSKPPNTKSFQLLIKEIEALNPVEPTPLNSGEILEINPNTFPYTEPSTLNQ